MIFRAFPDFNFFMRPSYFLQMPFHENLRSVSALRQNRKSSPLPRYEYQGLAYTDARLGPPFWEGGLSLSLSLSSRPQKMLIYWIVIAIVSSYLPFQLHIPYVICHMFKGRGASHMSFMILGVLSWHLS